MNEILEKTGIVMNINEFTATYSLEDAKGLLWTIVKRSLGSDDSAYDKPSERALQLSFYENLCLLLNDIYRTQGKA